MTSKLNLRLDEPLRRKLERAAEREGRSMQTEIVHRLEMSFRADAVREKFTKVPELRDVIERLSRIEKELGHEGTS